MQGVKKTRRGRRWDTIFKSVARMMQNNDASHDLYHVQRVIRNADRILETVQWAARDEELVRVVALCHETCDSKYVQSKSDSVAALRAHLESAHFPPGFIDVVCEVVPRLSFSKRLVHGTPDFSTDRARRVYELVSDADYLEALGTTGFLRTHIFQATHGKTAAEAIRHMEAVLYQCVDHMRFEWSRSEGAKRLEVMKFVVEEYKREHAV